MPTALIVEDEPEANTLLSLLVQLRGYSTVSAFTGNEALEKIEDRPPDIIFLDLMLPDINGYEVCRKLKSERSTSLIPIVMVTARIASENRHESYGVGADDYIPKPYTPDQIFQAMAEADAWRRSLERHAHQGLIPFTGQLDDAWRQLAQLRNLLVARTPLGLDTIRSIMEALQASARSADLWAHRECQNLVAELTYRLEPGRVSFSMRDCSGWLSHTRFTPGETWLNALREAEFDEITFDSDGRFLEFSRHFAALHEPGSDVNGR